MQEMNLLQSFIDHREERGVHFYDSTSTEWVAWDKVFQAVEALKLPDDAADKIVDIMANYDAKNEFVAVKMSGKGLTIEVFRASKLS